MIKTELQKNKEVAAATKHALAQHADHVFFGIKIYQPNHWQLKETFDLLMK